MLEPRPNAPVEGLLCRPFFPEPNEVLDGLQRDADPGVILGTVFCCDGGGRALAGSAQGDICGHAPVAPDLALIHSHAAEGIGARG